MASGDGANYYQSVVSSPTTDISEPRKRLSKHEKLSFRWALGFFGTLIQIGIVIWLGLRPDYPFIPGYLRRHGLYYFAWVATIVSLQIFLNVWLDWKQALGTDWFPGTMFLLASSTFYYAGASFWFLVVKEPLRNRVGKANFIMISEVLFSIMWLFLIAGSKAFVQTVELIPFPTAIPEVATTLAGAMLVFIGFFVKGWSCVLTGFNSYFWRDMVTDIPNSHFVESSLFKVVRHPCYTIGYSQVLGFAIFYRSVVGFLSYAGMQSCMLMFVYFVEQPFIERTYNVAQTKDPKLCNESCTGGLSSQKSVQMHRSPLARVFRHASSFELFNNQKTKKQLSNERM